MIVEIEAKFACDDCGTEFLVEIDPAYVAPAGWSTFAIAEDVIRGGLTYRDGVETEGGTGSVEDGRHYCARCTKRRDRSDAGVPADAAGI